MPDDSVITDEMKKMVGILVGPRVYEIDKSMIIAFVQAVGDPNPLYRDDAAAREAGYGMVIAPPAFPVALDLGEQTEWVTSVRCVLPRTLNGGTEHEYYQPIRLGDTISVTGKLVDMKERRSSSQPILFMTVERTYTNQQNEVVAKAKLVFIRR